jgi:hypothetical protein
LHGAAGTTTRMGRYLTASAIFRGEDLCTREVEAALRWLQCKGSTQFVDWLPDNLQSAICNVPPVSPPGVDTSATFVGNNTAIRSGEGGEGIYRSTFLKYFKEIFPHSFCLSVRLC